MLSVCSNTALYYQQLAWNAECIMLYTQLSLLSEGGRLHVVWVNVRWLVSVCWLLVKLQMANIVQPYICKDSHHRVWVYASLDNLLIRVFSGGWSEWSKAHCTSRGHSPATINHCNSYHCSDIGFWTFANWKVCIMTFFFRGVHV